MERNGALVRAYSLRCLSSSEPSVPTSPSASLSIIIIIITTIIIVIIAVTTYIHKINISTAQSKKY